MVENFELDKCDRLILLYLYLVEMARLRDIVDKLGEMCEKLRDRSSFYRRIRRRMISSGLVEKINVKGINYYRLTEVGERAVVGGLRTGEELRLLIRGIVEKMGFSEIGSRDLEFIRFDFAINCGGKIRYIKIVNGFTLPKNVEEFKEILKVAEFGGEKDMFYRLRKHFDIIVDEKSYLNSLINLAQRYIDNEYMLIIIGTDPKEIPIEIKDIISDVGGRIKQILDRALDRMEVVVRQAPKNLRILFTNNKTLDRLEKEIVEFLELK